MTETLPDQQPVITCYRCGRAISPGEGRYNVLPGESYCSWTCLHLSLRHIADAIGWFTEELHQPS